MARLDATGERAAVQRILGLLGPPPNGVRGAGDDCAALPLGSDYLCVTTDGVTEGVHFPAEAPRDLVGWHAVAVNLSDLAAKGARPLGVTVALSAPRDRDAEELYALMRGAVRCAREHGTAVVGGDTKEGAALAAAGTAFGLVPQDRYVPRSGAKPGDLVVVTGRVGAAAVAWQRWRERRDPKDLRGLLRTKPRLAAGHALAAKRLATAMTDTSDGLATACRLLGEASRVVVQLDWEQLPLAGGYASAFPDGPIETPALGFGGDYELCFTTPDRDDALLRLRRALAASSTEVAVVGVCEKPGRRPAGTPHRSGDVFLRHGERLLPVRDLGWEQFRSSA